MILDGERGLSLQQVDKPLPRDNEVLLRVLACGICRTDLHVLDADLPDPNLPLIMGHQIVARVEQAPAQGQLKAGDLVGVPWLGWTCGCCRYCENNEENLCPEARFTGYQLNGGFAEWAVADVRFCFKIPEGYPPVQAAPLLCAGLIGYRSYRMTGKAERLGLYGFGAAAHILNQVAVFEGRKTYAFTREGDTRGQKFARSLGACWAGSSESLPPEPLDAAIIFAPVGALVPAALRAVRPGGVVVCAGIHMSDIPSFPYKILWEERSLRSVANLTRRDGEEFLRLAPTVPVKTEVHLYTLEDTPQALEDLRNGAFDGAAVIQIAKE